MNKIDLYQRVRLTKDVPDENLKADDIAVLIDYVDHPAGGEEGAILEIFNILGESLDVAIVPVSAIEAVSADQVPSVRRLHQIAS